MSTKEGTAQREVIDYLRSRGHWVLPHKTSATYDSRIGTYRAMTAYNGTVGESDLLVFSKSSPISPIWMEMKKPGKRKIDRDQIQFKAMAQEWGHEYVVVNSVKDCEDLGL